MKRKRVTAWVQEQAGFATTSTWFRLLVSDRDEYAGHVTIFAKPNSTPYFQWSVVTEQNVSTHRKLAAHGTAKTKRAAMQAVDMLLPLYGFELTSDEWKERAHKATAEFTKTIVEDALAKKRTRTGKR